MIIHHLFLLGVLILLLVEVLMDAESRCEVDLWPSPLVMDLLLFVLRRGRVTFEGGCVFEVGAGVHVTARNGLGLLHLVWGH